MEEEGGKGGRKASAKQPALERGCPRMKPGYD